MHNAGYEALGIDDKFVFIAAQTDVRDIKKIVEAVRAMGIRGLTCTMPHKIEVMPFLDEIDPIAQKIGAVNTVVNENGHLKGYNTDWLGVVTPLEKHVSLSGKKVAIIGAGGAARSMAFGVLQKGATLAIFNRTLAKAERLAQEFGAQARNMSQIELVKDFDIILNATSLGMGEYVDKTPVPKEYLHNHHIVFDAVYVPRETQLMKDSAEQGARIIYGSEMLLYQGVAQFELYTGEKAPIDVMREVCSV